MIILGINAFHPDSSICLLINGKVALRTEIMAESAGTLSQIQIVKKAPIRTVMSAAQERQHQHNAVGHAGAAKLKGFGQHGHTIRNLRNGLRTGIKLRDSKGDIERTQSHDERR